MTTLAESLHAFLRDQGCQPGQILGNMPLAFYAGAAAMAQQFARADIIGSIYDMAQLQQLRASYVYVWSFQRGGWWKPNEHGYTTGLTEAGKYSFQRAWDICQRANVRHVQEAIVPVNPLWLEYGLPAGKPGAAE